MSFNPRSFKVLSFDIYGTLIDWESGIYTSLFPLLSRLPPSHPNHPSANTETQNRTFILSAYTKLELEIQKQNPTLAYPKVLAAIYARLASDLSLSIKDDEASAFGATIGSWPAFSDTVAAMQILAKHYKLVVLSNVDKASFSRTLSDSLAGVQFDGIYTAEDIGSYKPNLRNFAYVVEKAENGLEAKMEEVLVVAQSLVHDHIPARKFGLRPGVWIERSPGGGDALMGGGWEEFGGEVELGGRFGTLGEFAEVVERAFMEQ